MSKHDMTKKDAWTATPNKTDEMIQGDTLKMERNNKMMKKKILPLKLQFFAESAGTEPMASGQNQQANTGGTQLPAESIDYEKIQQMLNGTLAAKEDTALKAYFKQQGLSQEDAEQAMAAYKQQKAANQPDVSALTQQVHEAREAAQKSEIDSKSILASVELGLDAKSIPYVLKMADFSKAVGQDGSINNEALKEAINKVIEDVPGLKPEPKQGTGFVQIGTSGNNAPIPNDELKAAFGIRN